MTPEVAIKGIEAGRCPPVVVVVGVETLMVRQVVDAVVAATVDAATAGFNHDRFYALDASGPSVVQAANTVPMMAARRLVHLNDVDRWDSKGRTDLDELAEYAKDPNPTTVLLISGGKVNGSRRLMRQAKKEDFLVNCEPLGQRQLPGWIRNQFKVRGHDVRGDVCQALAEMVGPELGPVRDAVERLSLYVGKNAAVDHEALCAVVTRVRQETVWQLVDALSVRDLKAASRALADAYNPKDGGLPLLGAIGWRVRQLAKLQGALAEDSDPNRAAKAAGVQPFAARKMVQQLRRLPPSTLARWTALMSEADLALKGSRRDGSVVVHSMLVAMCGAS